MVPPAVVASVFSLDGRPHYLHSGWLLISAANLAVIVAMIVVFLAALLVPFPHDDDEEGRS